MVGTSLPLALQTGWLPARDCGGQQHGVSGGRRLPSALEAASPLGTSVCTALPGKARLRTGTAAACAEYWRAGCKPGRGWPQPGRMTGSADFRTGDGRARTWGCVRPGRPTAGPLATGCRGDASGACGHRFRVAASCRSVQRRDGPG